MKFFAHDGLPHYRQNPIAQSYYGLSFETGHWVLTRRYSDHANDQVMTQSLNIPRLNLNRMYRSPCFNGSSRQSDIQIPIEKNGSVSPAPDPRGFLHRVL
jgi:hypothetical protein